jgi:ABC-type Fe3+ transport system permease subunit
MLRELLEEGSLIEIITTFLALALIVAAILCLAYIIVGGITFILSAGNEEKIKRAVNTIRFAIIGLFVAFIAFFVVAFIARLLDIPFEIDFGTVVDLMGEIFSALGG